MASGGGVDVRVNKHISIRPVQLDYWTMPVSLGALMKTNLLGLKLGVNGFRYSAGAVVHF